MKIKIITHVALAIFISFSSMFLVSCQFTKEQIAFHKFAEIANQGEHSYRQYQTADYGAAKASLLEYINALDKFQVEYDCLKDNTCIADTVISFVRLAKLEEKYNKGDKEKYMQEAIVRCKKTNWDCSETKLRQIVDKIDQVPVK